MIQKTAKGIWDIVLDSYGLNVYLREDEVVVYESAWEKDFLKRVELELQTLLKNATHIHALGNPKYKLRYPLLVTIEQYQDEVIASIPEFDLYAGGVSASLALSKLKSEIVSTYDRLIELGPDKLGGFMLQVLEAMQAVIVEASR